MARREGSSWKLPVGMDLILLSLRWIAASGPLTLTGKRISLLLDILRTWSFLFAVFMFITRLKSEISL